MVQLNNGQIGMSASWQVGRVSYWRLPLLTAASITGIGRLGGVKE
jgi:hypothetical protein